MTNLAKEKDAFFNVLEITNMDNKRILDFMITEHGDIDVFVKDFLNKSDNVYCCIEKFRLYKKEMASVNYEEFENLYNHDKKTAIETILQEPVSMTHVDMLAGIDSKAVYEESKNNLRHTFITLYNTLTRIKEKVVA